ncbi:hypothetical protein N4000200 [Escherichia phage vB_EcoM_HZ_ZJUN4]|nr:hypothetical protein [Escherichia phage W143]
MHIVLFKPTPYSESYCVRKNTKFKLPISSAWELVLDIPAEESPPFGRVEFIEFVVRPTKRQIRQCKRYFRKIVKLEKQLLMLVK